MQFFELVLFIYKGLFMKPGLFGQSKLSFEKALELVKSGQDIKVSDLGFEINHIGRDRECNFYDSANFDNDKTYKYDLTILHAAIKYNRIGFVDELIKSGADKSIDMNVSYKHKQRNNLDYTGWSSWEIQSEWKRTDSTINMAQGKNEILELLNAAPVLN